MAIQIPDTIERTAEPVCPYFGKCGGCSLQDVPYEEQLRVKKEILSEMLGLEIPIVGSPTPWQYRHRMDFTTAFGKLGLRERGNFKSLVNLSECHIVSERVSSLMPKIQQWIEDYEIRGYNFITNRGDLRYITFRYAFSSDQLMLIVVTASEETAVAPLMDRLASEAESLVWAVQGRHGEDSHGKIQEIRGRKTLTQKIGDKEFLISPDCFFQNNLHLVDQMYDEVTRYVSGYTMDLYCGTGTIGIYVAQQATRVLGVEILEENLTLADENARRNGIENVEFVLDNANHFLAHYEGDVPDTLILDPPRSGLSPKFIRKLNRLGAQRIVYVSCNPKTYLVDLEQLELYKLVSAKAFDMFPQTPHVELVTVLEKK